MRSLLRNTLLAISATALILFILSKMTIQMVDREPGPIRDLKTIYAAQIQYQSTFNKFATSLTQLDSLIPESLARGEASGYIFTLGATPTGFTISAVPKIFGTTGRRTFFMDQSGIVRQNWGPGPATASSPEAASVSIQR